MSLTYTPMLSFKKLVLTLLAATLEVAFELAHCSSIRSSAAEGAPRPGDPERT